MKKLFLLPLLVIFAVACNTMQESVEITSMPEGADVYINGENRGQTPLRVALDKDSTYEIIITKAGYKPQTQHISPSISTNLIKFGPLVDMGYYHGLKPDPLESELTPDFLPSTPGHKPFEGVTYAILQADSLLASGMVSKKEHTYMVETIVKFFSQNQETAPEAATDEPAPAAAE